jgi:hypothetical protein
VNGKGKYGIRRTVSEPSDLGPTLILKHLIVKDGTCRVVEERTHLLTHVSENSYPRMLLLRSRTRDPNTGNYVTTLFDGVLPNNRELLFQFLDDSGRELGIF